jgi:hypothetical protein
MTALLREAAGPARPAPHDLIIDPGTVTEPRRHLIPRFSDPVWPLAATSANPSVAEVQIHWASFPAGLREQFRLATWVLLNIPVPDPVLIRRGAAMRPMLSTLKTYHTVTNWRTFATWLTGRDITALSAVTAEVLTGYSVYLARTRRVARMTAVNHLVALTRLAAYAPVLPEDLRIQAPAWDLEGLDHYLPAASATGENATAPIDAATIGPLLVWAVRFVEEFSGDVLAARAEEQRLRDIAGRHAAMPATRGRPPALLAYLDGLESAGLPVPTLPRQHEKAAATYIAGLAGVPAAHVRRVFGQPRWRSYLAANPGPCPLDIKVRGSIDGTPWVTPVNFDEVRPLTRHLVTACYIVIAYLTGMRASEVLALESGCCPDPGDSDPSRARRSLIYARQFKTARDTDGNHVSAGVLREAPWVAVPQVAHAVRVLEAIAGPGLLFATGRRERAGRSLGLRTMGDRIEEFAAWVNARTFRAGADATIPDDPHGPLTVSRFRRTLAWHIARQPGGLVALAIQYGHMRTVVSESYSSRARGGIHELLDLETARAVAEHLSDVHESLEQGEGVSGPAGR